MSSSIVRRGLELFKEDIAEESPKKKSRKKIHSTNRQDLLAHVSSKKTGVKRQLKRLKGESQRQKTTVKTMKLKSAFSKLSKDDAEDQTEENIDYLLRLDGNKGRFSSQAQKIIDHSRGKLTKDNPLPVTEAKVETSAFSEEDFANFEKDYVARRKIDNLLLDFQS
ncbi:hypothetical protein BSL78_16359 [Apostichopus japonicus]|uniref:Active regulator of SIRT1 n=1 Tax=Stichopus japonicus TaxID=307972 RepID=A0A2G8KFH9_STIJA|nr:hypothetical protein BSL78_16359 [Apostichopus japonicus]